MTYESLKRACYGYPENSAAARLAHVALNVEFGKAMIYGGSKDPVEMLRAARLHLITHRAMIRVDVDAILHHLNEIAKRAHASNELLETWELESYDTYVEETLADEPASTRKLVARGLAGRRRREFGV